MIAVVVVSTGGTNQVAINLIVQHVCMQLEKVRFVLETGGPGSNPRIAADPKSLVVDGQINPFF